MPVDKKPNDANSPQYLGALRYEPQGIVAEPRAGILSPRIAQAQESVATAPDSPIKPSRWRSVGKSEVRWGFRTQTDEASLIAVNVASPA